MSNRNLFLFIAAIGLLCFTTGCNSGSVVQEKFTIPSGEWNIKQGFVAKVNISDTQNPYNFYLNIRNGGNYPYSNLHVFVTTTFPNGKKAIDTVNCTLADKSGRWLGSGMGDLIDNRIMYKFNRKFPLKGKYLFTIQHAMRDTMVPAIFNVGLSIEKTN